MFNNYIMNTFFMSKKIYFNNKLLDKYQTKAVLCNKNAYLVVAGAGSGKTFTICAKVKYLIENGISPNKIACISFTNETVNSLKKELNKNNINIDVKTFHKLSLDIIGREKQLVAPDTLKYIIDEYFYSLIYFDNTYKLLKYIKNIDNVKHVIESFINQMKTYNYDEKYVLNLLYNRLIETDEKIILVLIYKIFIIYKEELNGCNKIDFNDIINMAVEKIFELDYFKYEYIIIDEYQDTSISKYNLLKKIQDKFNTKIMAVGDDFQSIYSFTGCNLNLFIKFKKLFKKSKIIKLKNTYRNPSDVVEISRRLVIKNRNQIDKRIKSNKYLNNSIVVVYISSIDKALEYVLEKDDNFLILGRNNRDVNLIMNCIAIKDSKFIYLKDESKNINFLTVHKSKGLEEDNVIILNMIDDTLGFPNKIKENRVLSYVKNYNEIEEERRLFYVALTRTRKRVYIFTQKNKESIFVKELIKDFKFKIKIEDLS